MDVVIAELIGLAILIIGALGTLVTVLVRRLESELTANTALTQQAKDAANGTLAACREELAAERNRTMGLRETLREREDRLAYIEARHPEIEGTIREYRERRTRRGELLETAIVIPSHQNH